MQVLKIHERRPVWKSAASMRFRPENISMKEALEFSISHHWAVDRRREHRTSGPVARS